MSNKIDELFNQASEKSVLDESGPITEIYIDFDYLQDLRFGTLLHLVKVASEMKYIHHKLPEYNKRYDFRCGKYFPALKHSDEEIDALLDDPKHIDKICFKAPFTDFYYDLRRILLLIHQHNRAASTKELRIHLQLNTDVLRYPRKLLMILKQDFMSQFKFLDVTITKCNSYELMLKEYTKASLLFIYNIEKFLKQDTPTSISFIGEGAFFDKKVFSFPYINSTVIKDPDQYQAALASTEKYLNIYCDFAYARNRIPQF